MSEILKRAFNTNVFRSQGHELIDMLADLLDSNQQGEGKVSNPTTPSEQLEFWRKYNIDSPLGFYDDLIKDSIKLYHPKYIGHQVSAPAPEAVLAGLVSDFLNNGMGVFEMGTAATAIEKVVIEIFCKKVGYSSDSDGFLTSGGTLANLTALLAARNHSQQQHPDKKRFILVSEQAHYCIDRAAATMGLATSQVIKVKTKEDFSMSIDHLSELLPIYNTGSNSILAIVASACSTATGSYDDVKRISHLCQKHNIWLHVDGAHGGAALWSKSYEHLMNGAELADSIIIDAHKMMLVPALTTAVLFRDGRTSYRTFQQAASYLFEKDEDEWHNLAKRTYETTKYMMSIKIFLLLRYYGDTLIDSFVTRQYDLTRQFAGYLHSRKDFEIGHKPMSNILCFRYLEAGRSNEVLNTLNAQIRKSIWEDGTFYIVQTQLNEIQYLRITIMNPHTTMEELKSLVQHILDKVTIIRLA
ncbi:MAG: L-2,4-diaminobutyrate decarboxylase [Saprospiraceae bacterium]|jgi:L-2,4-diaminobutyrate decarboxylase